MKKKYNIFIISRLYLKKYHKFLINNTDIESTEDAYSLFIYSMKKIYGLDTIEFSSCIMKYGEDCIKFIRETKDAPDAKDLNCMSFEDKVRVVSVCEGYAQAIGILSEEFISNSRVQ